MDFHWLDAKRSSYLHVGCVEESIASIHMSKSGLSWRVDFEIPGVFLDKNWIKGPLGTAKNIVEGKAGQWFGMANTSRPAMELPDA